MYRVTEVKVPDEIKTRLEKSKDLSDSEIKDLLKDARIPLGKREDLEENKDVELAMNASMRKFVDDYTVYIEKERVTEVDKDIDGRFRGIGVQIRRDVARDALLVVTPIRGSPAYKAGILAGDLVTEIIRESDDKGVALPTPEITSTKGMETTDAVKLIMGLPTTKLKLKVEREGSPKPLIIELSRDTVNVESVYGYKRNEKDDSWDYYIDPKNKIAYLYLTQFARNSAEDMLKAVKQISKEGAKGVVLDLRFNPGGFLDVAIDICDMFVDDGVIVSIRPGNSRANERIIKGKSEGLSRFPNGLPGQRWQRSGSEILPRAPGPRPSRDHGRPQLRQGQRAECRKVSAHGWEDQVDDSHLLAAKRSQLNKASTTGKDEDEWGVHPDKGYAVKLDRAEKDELFDRIYNWGVIARKDIPPKEPKKEFKDRQLEMALDYLRGQIKISRGDGKSGKDG